jgi:hypothetical protein
MTESLLARVRKLLAMAEDPACTPAEAEAFTAKATVRLAEQSATDEAAPGTDLVLADRTELVEQRRDEVYPRLARLGPRRLRGGGLLRGYHAGQVADLGGRSVSSS